MKTKEIFAFSEICDYCGAAATYDALTTEGHWAFMCEDCYHAHCRPGGLGVKYVVVDKPEVEGKGMTLTANELSDLETIVMDGERIVECPACGTEREVEPDADYTYKCEGCGAKVKVTAMPF